VVLCNKLRRITLRALYALFFYAMDNELIKLVLDKALKDGQTPARIKAFAEVIKALKGTTPPPKPNEVKAEPNDQELNEDKMLDFSEITGLQVDGGPTQKVKVYA